MRSTILITSIFVGIAAAAPVQVATVSSTAQFQLREAQIKPGQGVPSWPAMDGDKIKSGNAPVLLTFADGSTVILDAHSEARVGMSSEEPMFRLLCGSAHYSLKTIPSVVLMANDKVVNPPEVIGSYKVDGGCTVGGGWTETKTVLVVAGAAAAAGAGVAIERATQGGDPVSPSR
jgi:hypothetical protein